MATTPSNAPNDSGRPLKPRPSLPVLNAAEQQSLRPELRDVVEYRKSGLSLNHIIGCPLDCAYCVRHIFDNFEMRSPRALMADHAAVEYLVQHPYFVANRTPLQLFNRATDPFLPDVKEHTFAVLEDLDRRGLTNRVLVITRYHVTADDCHRLNRLQSVRLTLLFTFSGIDDPRIEPVSSDIAARSLRVAHAEAVRYSTVLYWRPIVPGLNDTDAHIQRAAKLSQEAHATVFTGLFYRQQTQAYYHAHGLPEPYQDVARRKILPEETESKLLARFAAFGGGAIFRKTSCGVVFGHGDPDYNGHIGVREVCDICPNAQIKRCESAHRAPSREEIQAHAAAAKLGPMQVVEVSERAALVEGYDEQRRYFLQHAFGFQFHDVAHPHHLRRHGRADIGWHHGEPAT